MAETISVYNGALAHLQKVGADNISPKLLLLNATATFDATHTTLTQVTNSGSYEVSGNGWTSGGESLTAFVVTTYATSGAKVDATDIDVTATGGAIGPADYAVIFDDSEASDKPLFFVNFDGSITAGEGTPFLVTLSANGLLTTTLS